MTQWNFDDLGRCPEADAFLEKGYVVFPAEDVAALSEIRSQLVALVRAKLSSRLPDDPEELLNQIHRHVPRDALNEFRVSIFQLLNALPWFRPAYFALGRKVLENLVSNELVMQRRINLSIQFPNDDSSLLPLHADVWSGDSPFEVVMWVPLVDCRGTKSMYLLPPEVSARFNREIAAHSGEGVKKASETVEPSRAFLEVPYGHCLVFNQCLPHGNDINTETETRWSFNCRFKSVFSPYADKKLGEFFSPIGLRPVTRIGLTYEWPSGFGAPDGVPPADRSDAP